MGRCLDTRVSENSRTQNGMHIILREKEGRADTHCNRDGPPKHRAEGGQPGAGDHLARGSTYMTCLQQADPQREEGDEWLPRAGGGAWLKGRKVPFQGRENVLKSIVVMVTQVCKDTKGN